MSILHLLWGSWARDQGLGQCPQVQAEWSRRQASPAGQTLPKLGPSVPCCPSESPSCTCGVWGTEGQDRWMPPRAPGNVPSEAVPWRRAGPVRHERGTRDE